MLSDVLQEIDNIASFFEDEEENIVAQTLKTRIVNRTLNGVDVNGVPFQGYTIAYGRKRVATGLDLTPVDLYALGNPHLLDSITKMDDHTLFFPAEFVPIAQGLQAKREFFGANESDWQECANAVAIKFNEHYGRK